MIPFNIYVRRLFKLSSIGEPVRSLVPLPCVVYQYIDYQLLQSGKKNNPFNSLLTYFFMSSHRYRAHLQLELSLQTGPKAYLSINISDV